MLGFGAYQIVGNSLSWVPMGNQFHIFNPERIIMYCIYIIWYWYVTMYSMKCNYVSNWRIWGRNSEKAWHLGRNVWVLDYREKCMGITQNAWELEGWSKCLTAFWKCLWYWFKKLTPGIDIHSLQQYTDKNKNLLHKCFQSILSILKIVYFTCPSRR